MIRHHPISARIQLIIRCVGVWVFWGYPPPVTQLARCFDCPYVPQPYNASMCYVSDRFAVERPSVVTPPVWRCWINVSKPQAIERLALLGGEWCLAYPNIFSSKLGSYSIIKR